MFRKAFAKSHLPLSELELQQRRQAQKKLLLIAVGILVLLGAGYAAARPTLRAVRGWQARRHAQKAFAAIDKQQWGPARDEAVAGYQLRPTEPQAIRAIAQLCSRAGQPDGLKFWKELRALTTLTRADLRDEVNLALRVRETDLAAASVKELLSNRDGGPTPADWLLAAQLAVQQQNLDAAALHVRQVFACTAATERDQFQATLILDTVLRGKESQDQSEVFSRLDALARGTGSVALDALVALAQRIGNAPPGTHRSDALGADDLIHALEAHPLAAPQHKLLAVDLKIHEHPEDKEKLIQAAVDQYKTGDNTVLIALAGWLNSHGEYQRELDAIPRQRAIQTRELFFQHVDAMGALDRWDEIRRLIESEQFPLDQVVEHMYLARCFAQQGQANGAENSWSRALQAAAGDVSKLLALAEYAEKNGAVDVAGAAYDAAVAVSPKARIAQQGRLRIAYAQRDTRKIHDILVDLLKVWPNDTAVQNDEAYARLLLTSHSSTPQQLNSSTSSSSSTSSPAASPSDQPSTLNPQPSTSSSPATSSSPSTLNPQPSTFALAELESIEALAAKLVEREPSSLPHRTLLALARLRLNRPADALAVYNGINVPKASLTTSSVVVHAAVLAANGHLEDARKEFANIPPGKSLPEEAALAPH